MMRFNEVTEGKVLLNGVDIREIPQSQLRDHLSFVQQRAWLFSGTIAENLRYGNPEATEEDLWHALEVAQAKDFVEALPDKLHSFCSARWHKLFGRTETAAFYCAGIGKET